MSLPYPRCGRNYEPHLSHYIGNGQECPGWTVDQKLVRDLITGVREYVREHYAPGEPCPDGLRVEMHPSVRRLLMTDPDLWERPGRECELDDWFPVPAKVTTDVPPGKWRLVIVTEEVLLEG
jgi:hypothetical protein